jgi:hypothetical protein
MTSAIFYHKKIDLYWIWRTIRNKKLDFTDVNKDEGIKSYFLVVFFLKYFTILPGLVDKIINAW